MRGRTTQHALASSGASWFVSERACIVRLVHTSVGRDSLSHDVLQFDDNGAHKTEFRCKNANFIFKTEVENEMEFLFSAYSVFKVIFLLGVSTIVDV